MSNDSVKKEFFVGSLGVLPIALFGILISILSGLFGYFLAWLPWRSSMAAPNFPAPNYPAATNFGDIAVPISLGIITLLLFGIFTLLLVLVCSCPCRPAAQPNFPGLPGLPALPQLPKVASILRDIAAKLREANHGVMLANENIDPLREALKNPGLIVSIPKFKDTGQSLPGFGRVWIPDGFDEKLLKDLMDDDTKSKVAHFIDDVTGREALIVGTEVVDKAAILLDETANNLEATT